MDTSTLISTLLPALVGAVSAVLAAAWSTRRTLSKHQAEERLIRMLVLASTATASGLAARQFTGERSRTSEKLTSVNLLRLTDSLLREPPDDESLARAEKMIEGILPQLSESERREISEGLHQYSERGRADYAAKLLLKTQSQVGKQLAGAHHS